MEYVDAVRGVVVFVLRQGLTVKLVMGKIASCYIDPPMLMDDTV